VERPIKAPLRRVETHDVSRDTQRAAAVAMSDYRAGASCCAVGCDRPKGTFPIACPSMLVSGRTGGMGEIDICAADPGRTCLHWAVKWTYGHVGLNVRFSRKQAWSGHQERRSREGCRGRGMVRAAVSMMPIRAGYLFADCYARAATGDAPPPP
jgi:hypothetical protein